MLLVSKSDKECLKSAWEGWTGRGGENIVDVVVCGGDEGRKSFLGYFFAKVLSLTARASGSACDGAVRGRCGGGAGVEGAGCRE